MAIQKPLVNISGEITEISTSDQIPHQNLASGTPSDGQAIVFDSGTGQATWETISGGGGGSVLTEQDPLLDPASYERNLVYNGGHGFMSDGADWKPISAVTWGLGSGYGMIPGHIYWQTPADIGTGTTSLDTPGGQEVVYGWRFTSVSGTVNGIVFEESSCENEGGQDTSGMLYTNSDATFQALLNSSEHRLNTAADTSVHLRIRLTGLTIGERYAVQLFFVDKRASWGQRNQRFLDEHGNESDNILGSAEKYVIGEFIASATTQLIYAKWISGYSDAASINLLVLRRYTGFLANLQLHLSSIPVLSVDSSRVNLGIGNRAYASLPANTTAIGSFSLSNATGAGNTALGFYAGNSLTSGTYNTLLGPYAGQKITTGGYNIALGSNSLGDASAAVTGSRNIGIGQSSGYLLTSGSDNIAIGKESLYQTTTGSNNVMVGTQAGYVNTASNNTGLGYHALDSNTSGTGNTAVGYIAGGAISTASNSTFLGHNAGSTLTGANNVVVGANAGGLLTGTGSDNILIGAGVAYNGALSGSFNTIIGSSAANNAISSASNATVVGYLTGRSLTTAIEVTLLGTEAGYTATTAPSITAIGHRALYSATTANSNVAIGKSALGLNGTGGQNTAVGHRASNNTTGGLNTTVGFEAHYTNASGVSNVAVGYQAGYAATVNWNTFIGYHAGRKVSSGSNNVAIGYQSLGENSAAFASSNCIGIGARSFYNATSGNGIAIGVDALNACTTGSLQVAIGDLAGTSITTGVQGTFVGREAGRYNTGSETTAIGCYSGGGSGSTGSGNIYLGRNAGALNGAHTGTYNIFIGQNAGAGFTSADDCIMIGREALSAAHSGAQAGTIAIGREALTSCTTGLRNVAIGYQTLASVATVDDNVALGWRALWKTTAAANTGLGVSAGQELTTGTENTLVGHDVADALNTGSYNVAFGSNALGAATTSSYNVCLGYNAGLGITTATGGNTCVGSSAGDNITTGSDNIVIGKDVDAQSPTASNQINIGNSFKRASDGNLSLDLGSGGTTVTCNGVFDIASNKITSLANGTASTDAVNKGQLDSAIASVSWSLMLSEKTDHYTILNADVGKLLVMNSSANKDFTVNGSLDLTAGQQIHILRTGAGEVSVAVSGATVNSPGGLRLRAQYSMATLLCVAADSYVLVGDLKV